MNIKLIQVSDDLRSEACELIKEFWKVHNGTVQTDEESNDDYLAWTCEGHILYLVKQGSEYIGFAHLGSRGATIDWLEDIFVIPKYQGQGVGSKIIEDLEKIVKTYSSSMYIEVAARNLRAMKLYNRLGYDCLNTITIRKDFNQSSLEVVKDERIGGYNFKITKNRNDEE